MAYLQLHDAHHQLAAGETRVGWGTDADIRLSDINAHSNAVRETSAVLALAPDQTATLRVTGGDGSVFLNGVRVGIKPAPLLDGDRVTIGRQRDVARGRDEPGALPDRHRRPTLLWGALPVLAAVAVFLVLQGR